MTSSIHIPSTLLEEIEPLTDSNWHTFNTQLITVLASNDSDDIITGMVIPPTDADQLTIYNKKNKLAKTYIWSRTSKEWHHLVEDKANGKLAYLALKTKFEASSFSRHITLCKAFYGCVHNPNEHVDIFLESVTKAKAQLEAIGIKVDDDATKDVILGNLDESFKDVKTSLLTQPTKPSLDIIHSILSTSNPLINPEANIKSKVGDIALATSKFRERRSGSGKKGEQGSGKGDAAKGRDDDRGYWWCDPTHDNHCHRCGRTGHIAPQCVTDMPLNIKSWVLSRPPLLRLPEKDPAHEFSHYIHVAQRSYSNSPTSSCGDISDALERALYAHPNSPSRRSRSPSVTSSCDGPEWRVRNLNLWEDIKGLLCFSVFPLFYICSYISPFKGSVSVSRWGSVGITISSRSYSHY